MYLVLVILILIAIFQTLIADFSLRKTERMSLVPVRVPSQTAKTIS